MNEKNVDEIASLYSAEAARMRALVRKRIGDVHEAGDLVNEAFRVLSERSRTEQIHNPAAFVWTVLQRQVDSHLRKKYRRMLVPMEEANEDQLPTSPDVADSFEDLEQQALVRESVGAIRSTRQRRVLKLTGLDLRPGEIAELETRAGRPVTSHQITCVLSRSLANLRLQFRQRGLVPSVLPAVLLTRFRNRLSNFSVANPHLSRLMDGGIALQAVLVIGLASVLGPRAAPHVPARPPQPQRAAGGEGAPRTENLSSLFVASADIANPHPVGYTGNPDPRTSETPGSAVPASAPPASPTQAPLPAPPGPELSPDPPLSPSARVSQEEGSLSASFEPVPGESASITHWQEQSETPAPPLVEQTQDLIEDPDRVPKPECGGLPPICSGGAQDNPSSSPDRQGGHP